MSVSTTPLLYTSTSGLTEREAQLRRARGQGNDADIQTGRTYLQILRDNVFTFFNLIFFGLGLMMVLLGSFNDAFFTVIVALINVFVTTFQEARAKRRLDRIGLLTRPKARVVRDGQEREIDPREIVLGDLLIAGTGDQIIVDGSAANGSLAEVDESLLTGESNVVTKTAGDLVLSGSFVLSGSLFYLATEVGAESFASKLTIAARAFRHQLTPFQVEINWLIRVLLLLVVIYEVMVLLAVWVRGGMTLLQITQEAAVIVGLSPVGLFMMLIAAYALGTVRISGRGAVVQRINAVESLSNVTVLCLDKTGTLTSGQLTLEGVYAPASLRSEPEQRSYDDTELQRVLRTYARSGSTSNATGRAIAQGCQGKRLPVQDEVLFSSARKWSALTFNEEELRGSLVLGAPEVLQPALAEAIDPAAAHTFAARGLRVLLLAQLRDGSLPRDKDGQPQLPTGLIQLCYVTLSDELRPAARQTLEDFRQAGITVKIISGDDPETIVALIRQIDQVQKDKPLSFVSGPELSRLNDAAYAQAILEHAVFGRMSPEQKQRLIRSLRSQGQYVAMVGDGVNDVLALKEAQVSVAMQSGSRAARDAADMVLLNDSFAALPHAFLEGQRILNGMQDILKLTLTHVYTLAFLLTTISMLVAGFPYTPSQNGFLTILSITIPTLGLTLWARPGPMPSGSRLWRLNRFVVPAALTTGLACLMIYLIAFRATRDFAYAQTMLTYCKTLLGLGLIPFLAPPTRFWVAGNPFSGDLRPTLLALATLGLLVIIVRSPIFQQLFGLTPLSRPIDLAIILAVAALWIIVTRWLWRNRLLERYLGIDWEAPLRP